MAALPDDPNVTVVDNGKRYFFYRGGQYTIRELYDHEDRTAELTYKQFYQRLRNQVRTGEVGLDWAMTRKIHTRCLHREVDVVYLGQEVDDLAHRVGEFMLKMQGGEPHRKMARRAAEVASHQGAHAGVYLIAMTTKTQQTQWWVGVWSGEVGQPKPWDTDRDDETNLREAFGERW